MDIVEELEFWNQLITETQGKAQVIMVSGEVFQTAADEICRLRSVVDSYRRHLTLGDLILGEAIDI